MRGLFHSSDHEAGAGQPFAEQVGTAGPGPVTGR
jgi:hypothetical protein